MFQFDVRPSRDRGITLMVLRNVLGSARVSRAGGGILAIADFFPKCHTARKREPNKGSSLRRDAATDTRDACATQTSARSRG
jgi:hypothetical protein